MRIIIASDLMTYLIAEKNPTASVATGLKPVATEQRRNP